MLQPSKEKKLIENFFSLSVIQVANLILPLITLPYLVRVLGVDYFGVLAVATATVSYFHVITDYGFNLTATRAISINRGEPLKIIEIFSSVMTLKVIFMILSFLIFQGVILSFDYFYKYQYIYIYTFGTVIGQVLFPVWFFLGMEEMKYAAYLNLLSKTIFTILIFTLVQTKEDYYLVPILTSLGFLVAGTLSLVVIYKKFHIKFRFQSRRTINKYLLEGWYIFTSNLANAFHTNSTVFILGIFTSTSIVGYYSAGERLIKIAQSLLGPFFQAIYPYLSIKSKSSSMKIIRKITIITGLFSFFISMVMFFYADFFVSLILGNQFEKSVNVVKVLSLLPLTYALSNVFGVQTMLNHGKHKEYSKIFIYAAILNIFLSFALVPLYAEIGTAIAVLITELFFTTHMFLYLQYNDLKIFNSSKNNYK